MCITGTLAGCLTFHCLIILYNSEKLNHLQEALLSFVAHIHLSQIASFIYGYTPLIPRLPRNLTADTFPARSCTMDLLIGSKTMLRTLENLLQPS
jgi:hypothetical protein